MKKRGISPLIATVILVGAVFAIGIVVHFFISDLAKEKTEDIKKTTQIDNLCISNTELEIINICKDKSSGEIKVTMENSGNYPVKNITFMSTSEGGLTSNTINKEIGKFERKTYVLPAMNNLEEISYIKNLDAGICNPVKIDVEKNSENLVINGNFDDGNSGWSGNSCADYSGDIVTLSNTGSCEESRSIQTLDLDREYTLRGRIKVIDPPTITSSIFVRAYVSGSPLPPLAGELYASPGVVGVWQNLSIVINNFDVYKSFDVEKFEIAIKEATSLSDYSEVQFDDISFVESGIPFCQ